MNIQALLKQAQKMQTQMTKVEKELSERVYEASAADGKLKVTCTGDYTVSKIEIDDEMLKDKEMLQDLIAVTLNAAITQAKGERNKIMGEITGGVKMPGAF